MREVMNQANKRKLKLIAKGFLIGMISNVVVTFYKGTEINIRLILSLIIASLLGSVIYFFLYISLGSKEGK